MSQTPPPTPLDEVGVPIAGNLLLLMLSGITYGFWHLNILKKNNKKNSHPSKKS